MWALGRYCTSPTSNFTQSCPVASRVKTSPPRTRRVSKLGSRSVMTACYHRMTTNTRNAPPGATRAYPGFGDTVPGHRVRRRVASGEYATPSQKSFATACAHSPRVSGLSKRGCVIPSCRPLPPSNPIRRAPWTPQMSARRWPNAAHHVVERGIRVVFAPGARDQLAELEATIASAGAPQTAAKYVDAIVTFCEQLESSPFPGVLRNDLLPGLRVTHYRGRTVIAYRERARRSQCSASTMVGRTTRPVFSRISMIRPPCAAAHHR